MWQGGQTGNLQTKHQHLLVSDTSSSMSSSFSGMSSNSFSDSMPSTSKPISMTQPNEISTLYHQQQQQPQCQQQQQQQQQQFLFPNHNQQQQQFNQQWSNHQMVTFPPYQQQQQQQWVPQPNFQNQPMTNQVLISSPQQPQYQQFNSNQTIANHSLQNHSLSQQQQQHHQHKRIRYNNNEPNNVIQNGPMNTVNTPLFSDGSANDEQNRNFIDGNENNGVLSMKPPEPTPLPNDSCDKTQNLEREFLSKFQVTEASYKDDQMSTVIYSRALKTKYLWPKNTPLTIDALSSFASAGHTLSIDYTETYCRMFALDLDCLCRKDPNTMTHLDEQTVQLIENKMLDLFKDVLQIDTSKTLVSKWRNRCGFHIYTNVFMSLPTHLYLARILQAGTSDKTVVIEVPSQMPLPFSAKKFGVVYQKINHKTEYNTMSLTINDGQKVFIDLFQLIGLYCSGRTVAKIISTHGTYYLQKLNDPIKKSAVSKLTNAKTVSLYENFSYMEQYKRYVCSMVQRYNKDYVRIGDVDLGIFSEEERFNIRCFMDEFNKLFSISNDNFEPNSCEIFIRMSAIDYGGLYLQPFTAALYLRINMTDFTRFKLLLNQLYKPVMDDHESIKTFVTLVNLATFQAYNSETTESILNHMHFLISRNVTPIQTLNDKINTLLEAMLNDTAENFSGLITQYAEKKSRQEACKLLDNLSASIKIIFEELGILYFDRTSLQYYNLELNIGHSYYSSTTPFKREILPKTISVWFGSSSMAIDRLKREIENSLHWCTQEPIEFSTNEYMFSTEVGVFNSAVGLYTAHTKFLKFNKNRKIAIWPHNTKIETYYAQNKDLLEQYKVVSRFVEIMENRMVELFTHAVFAPAIIQCRDFWSIDEKTMELLFNHLEQYDNFECMYFLMDYYQFPPKIVYLMMYICFHYGGIRTIYLYKTMCIRIFSKEDVGAILWKSKFEDVLESVTYDKTKPTYIERLETMRGMDNIKVHKGTLLMIIIALVCIRKTWSFKNFYTAFNIEIPSTYDVHKDYEGILLTTTPLAMKLNFDRARNIVFGRNLTQFERLLSEECFSICISANFNPETVRNYLTAVSTTFIPVNKSKKLILFQGESDVGKSYICDKIKEMMLPNIAQVLHASSFFNRSQLGKFSALIINEANLLDASEIKSITGNDGESIKTFYTQNYNLQSINMLLFGATNIHVSFKGPTDVDRTTIMRLYTILFTGKQCQPENPQATFISMLVNRYYYTKIVTPTVVELAGALAWLSFGIYMTRRDENYFPHLDVTCQTSRNYQDIVYYNNSKLYRFLVESGITNAQDFHISSNRLLEIVSQNLDKNGTDGFSTLKQFCTAFQKQYGIMLNQETTVHHFQQFGLVQHIMDNMRVIPDPESIITKDELENRLDVYSLPEHRDNANMYFLRCQSKHFDHDNSVYRNIAFATESTQLISTFVNNTTSHSMTMDISSNSLVMKDL